MSPECPEESLSVNLLAMHVAKGTPHCLEKSQCHVCDSELESVGLSRGLSQNSYWPSTQIFMHTYCANLTANQENADNAAANNASSLHAMSSCYREGFG
jgi:hypothetical protein